MGVRMTAAAAAAAVAFSGLAVSATTINTDPDGNQIFIDFTPIGADVDLGAFNLADSPLGIQSAFDSQDIDGSVRFALYSDPASQGAKGSIDLNFTQQDGTVGSDNESFSGTAGALPLSFELLDGDLVANFAIASLGTTAATATEFFLDFSGFDEGDQFQVNAARVVPLPASLPLLLAALGGLGYLARRRPA